VSSGVHLVQTALQVQVCRCLKDFPALP
jgi:hypothetical protein